jgi:hypothetical protein
MMARMVTRAVALTVWFALAGCGGPPGWVRTAPEDGQYFYAVGIRSDAPTLEEGKRSAAANAVEQLLERFGIRARARYRELKSELQTKVRDELASVSESVMLRDHYLFRWDYTSRRVSDRLSYDVYVLVRYPKTEWARERARLEQRALERRLRAHVQLAVDLHEDDDGKPLLPGIVRTALAHRLRGAGFSVREVLREEGADLAMPDVLVTGRCMARQARQMLDGVYASRASGEIQAVDSETGEVLARVTGEEAGFADSASEAGRRALATLAEGLADALVKELRGGSTAPREQEVRRP